MIRSLYAVPAMFCLAAALVTAQAPAQDRPASNTPAAQQPAPPAPAAQQPTTPRPTTPPASAQEPSRPHEASSSTANTVTYVGCLKPGPTSGTWILENAEVAQRTGASTSSSATVGTSGTSKTSFNLDPAATVNLKPHANHKVEVVGMLSAPHAGAAAAPSTAVSGEKSSTSAAAARQQFSVESMKMVSSTCP